jgi:hypothetical protein
LVNLSQNGPHPRWKRPAHVLGVATLSQPEGGNGRNGALVSVERGALLSVGRGGPSRSPSPATGSVAHVLAGAPPTTTEQQLRHQRVLGMQQPCPRALQHRDLVMPLAQQPPRRRDACATDAHVSPSQTQAAKYSYSNRPEEDRRAHAPGGSHAHSCSSSASSSSSSSSSCSSSSCGGCGGGCASGVHRRPSIRVERLAASSPTPFTNAFCQRLLPTPQPSWHRGSPSSRRRASSQRTTAP